MPRKNQRAFDKQWGGASPAGNPWDDYQKGSLHDPTGLKAARAAKRMNMHIFSRALGIKIALLDQIERGEVPLEEALTPEQLTRLKELLSV